MTRMGAAPRPAPFPSRPIARAARLQLSLPRISCDAGALFALVAYFGPSAAVAYRPFVATDAAVAGPGEGGSSGSRRGRLSAGPTT